MGQIDIKFKDLGLYRGFKSGLKHRLRKLGEKSDNRNVFRAVIDVAAIVIMLVIMFGLIKVVQVKEMAVESPEIPKIGEEMVILENVAEESTPTPSPVDIVEEVARVEDIRPVASGQGEATHGVGVTATVVEMDPRIIQLFSFLESYGSPIPEVATTIVGWSEVNGVDPYVVAAIFCQESSCGKATEGGNSTGYGKTDSGPVGVVEFESIELGLEHMIEKFSTDWGGAYKACGTDIQCISDTGYNTRDSWVTGVQWFYGQIINF